MLLEKLGFVTCCVQAEKHVGLCDLQWLFLSKPYNLCCLTCCVQGVDYIGLCELRRRLLFHATSPESLHDLVLPLGTVRRFGALHLATDLLDTHLYIFSR
jgi:hypothetical protein